jgi:hypothetical protein
MTDAIDNPRALVSSNADFWLVGGASLVAFAIFVAITEMLHVNLGNHPYYWAFYLSFLVNDPHFIYSYFLFYRGFKKRLKSPEIEKFSRLRYFIAGVAVPAVMTAFIFFALLNPDPKYVGWATGAMIFSVGWHYAKQGYGVLITLSLYEGVVYSAVEKRILWLTSYALWIYSCVNGVIFSTRLINPADYSAAPAADMAHHWTDKPALYGLLLIVPAAVTVVRHWRKEGGISGNGVLGYACACGMWLLMPFINPGFLPIIPMFHSLQYLPFVYKMKKSELSQVERGWMLKRAMQATLLFTLGGIALGAVFFELLPKYLDRQAAGHGGLHPEFFFFMFLSFINIHHYFMDSAYWRRDNAEVQRDLFRA